MSYSTFTISARGFGKSSFLYEHLKTVEELALRELEERKIAEQKEIQNNHFLHKVISEILPALDEDLCFIEYRKQYSEITQTIEALLSDKIKERLLQHFYDDLPEYVESIFDLITLKLWPHDWGKPENILCIEGKSNLFLVVFSLPYKQRQLTPEQRKVKQKKLQKQRNKKYATESIKHLSRHLSRKR